VRSLASLLSFLSCTLMIITTSCSSSEESAGERPRRGDPATMFQKLDANQDGVLSWDEFKDVPARNLPADEMFKKLDADGDGVVTKDEFMSMRQGGPDGERGQRRMR